MWKILGEETLYLGIAETWKSRMLALAGDDEPSKEFKKILEDSEVEYLFNAISEEHTFFIRLKDEITPEQIQNMADVSLGILKALEYPCVAVEDVEQRYKVIITNYHEPEIIGLNKTEGYSSGAVFMPIISSLDAPGKPNMGL
ncbi:MAG: hypothetical protein IJ856_00960 [Candidatus Methanomethylophilaceae archaeon]|nr:hypothetical protein [Candidatus Methanomethylophilaceae archaeon]